MSSWSTVGARTSGLGSFTHDLAPADDATLSSCIANINNAGMTLTVEASSYQGDAPDGCGDVEGCYAVTYNTVSRLISLGMSASQIRIRMQEPLTTAHIYGCGGCNDGDVVNYTVTYLSWLRNDFPGIQVSSIEAYPYIPLSTINWWIAALDAAAEGAGVSPPDAFEIDHDMNASGWSWSGISSIINTAHTAGWVAGYIFGSPVIPGRTWQYTANIAGSNLRNNGITPDAFVFESFETSADPLYTIPETVSSGYTFMSVAKGFIDFGLFPW